MRLLTLVVISVGCCNALSQGPLVHDHQTYRRLASSTSRRDRCGNSMEVQGSRDSFETETRIGSSGLKRESFVRAVATALTFVAIGQRAKPALGVGIQPGERTTAPPNALLLVPALRAKLAVQNLLDLLRNPATWDQAREALKYPPLAPGDFKQCFRTYSDADPEQHLAFDLYRIQAQDALKAVSELLAYLASEKNKGSKIDRDDLQDLEEAGNSVLQGIDDFLALAPHDDVMNAADQARVQAGLKSAKAVAAARVRELEGAVIGEGAFASGVWLGM